MAEQLPATRTPVSIDQLIFALRAIWEETLGEQPAVNSLAVLAAQWSLETGDGRSMIAFNIGNFKSIEGDGRDFTFFTTWEELPPPTAASMVAKNTMERPCNVIGPGAHGLVKVRFSPNHPVCRFRAYRSLSDGAVDYLRTLKGRFSLSWPAVRMGDPKMFALLLHRQGYYTASVESYTAALVGRFMGTQQAALRVNADADTTPRLELPHALDPDNPPIPLYPDPDDDEPPDVA